MKAPSKRCPIVQSYVDLFMTGCINMQERYQLDGFAMQCATTTHGWEGEWVNDRIYPHRAFVHQPNAFKIDKILAKAVPKEFKSIKLQ